MSSIGDAETPPRGAPGRRLSTYLYRRPRLRLGALLATPLGWLGVAYLGSLFVLFLAAFWRLDPLATHVVHDYSLDNFRTLVEEPVYRTITLRTVGTAAAVTGDGFGETGDDITAAGGACRVGGWSGSAVPAAA